MQPKKSESPIEHNGKRASPGRDIAPHGKPLGYSGQTEADFARTWHFFLERFWVVMVAVVVCVGLGFAYIKYAPTLYSATATVQAEQTMPNILKLEPFQLGDLQAVDYLQTVAQSLTARPLLERVAETNHLWTDARFMSLTNKTPTHNQVIFALNRMVKVKLRHNTRLIDITVTHRDPVLCATIANSIVSESINAGAERQDTSIAMASKSLQKEAEELRMKLEASENALQAYKEETKSTSLDEHENTVVEKLKEISKKATEAKSVRIRFETEYSQAINLGTNVEALLNTPTVAQDPNVQALVLSLTKAEDDFAGVCRRYKQKHPKYIQAATQIAKLKGDITNAVLKAVETLKVGLDTARSSEEALNEAMRTQEAATIELSKMSIRYNGLEREVQSDRALYDAVLKGLKEASVTKDTQQTGIIGMVEPATPPELPVSPRKAAALAMSGLAGIFLGICIVLCLRVIDTSIKTVDDAEAALGLTVCSVVPKIHGLKNGHSRLVVSEKALSEGAEAFRTLRTFLSTLGKSESGRASLFTSAMPSEGKTFCSINYAASLAQLGCKTLLIDADLRRPSVETILLNRTGSAGLTDCLGGKKKLEEVVQPTTIENLFLLAGGSIAPNPAEMLAQDGLKSILEEALRNYDRVVLDSAPINAVSDTLLLVRNVQEVCLVVRASSTSSRYVRRCVQLLRGAEASLCGIVLNGMRHNRRFSYGAYYDYQHHGEYGTKGVYGRH